KVQKWLQARTSSFPRGVRHLLGKPITPDALRLVLREGRQRQRAAAALELSLQKRGTPLWEVRAPGVRQREWLAEPRTERFTMRVIFLTAALSVVPARADHPQDTEGVWALELRVQSMRTITVEVPGQGKKTFHYLRYEIVNNTGEARQATPAFELVTHDTQK